MVAFRRNRLEERQLWRISIWRCLACALQCHPPRRIIKRLCLQGKWRSWGMPSRCLLQTWPPMTSQSWQNVKNVLWEGWTGVNAVIEGQASGLCRGVVYYCELCGFLISSYHCVIGKIMYSSYFSTGCCINLPDNSLLDLILYNFIIFLAHLWILLQLFEKSLESL